MPTRRLTRACAGAVLLLACAVPIVLDAKQQTQSPKPVADLAMVARIREEGLQRSRLMDTVSYITDVLGARLTLSDDMARAQAWVQSHMREIGLERVAA